MLLVHLAHVILFEVLHRRIRLFTRLADEVQHLMYFVIFIRFAPDGEFGISLFKSFLLIWLKYFANSILLPLLARHSLLSDFSNGFALGAGLTLVALRTLILAIVLLTDLRDILMAALGPFGALALLLVDNLQLFALCLIQYFLEILLRLLYQTLLANQNLAPFFVHQFAGLLLVHQFCQIPVSGFGVLAKSVRLKLVGIGLGEFELF